MERAYIEEDPHSQPEVTSYSHGHFYSTPESKTPPLFVVDAELAAQKEQQQALVEHKASSRTFGTRRCWVLSGLVVLVVVVVAAVVGGVVGSQHKTHENKDVSSSNHPSALTTTVSSTTRTTTTAQTTTAATRSTTTTTTTTTTSSSTTEASVITAPTQNSAYPAVVKMYANDTCGGNEDVFAVTQSNVSTCMAVTSDKTSLQVTQNSGCVVETWSGSNCEGSSYNVTDLQCHAVLYAAVSVDC